MKTMMLSKFIYAVFCAETAFCSKPLIGFSFHAHSIFPCSHTCHQTRDERQRVRAEVHECMLRMRHDTDT